MKQKPDVEQYKSSVPGYVQGDCRNGCFAIPYRDGIVLNVVASDGMGWEHVSVSLPDRCPTWEEMCFIKDVFWEEYETVIQYHPPKKDYVNCHPYCLHMWKPVGKKFPKPPTLFVGPKRLM